MDCTCHTRQMRCTAAGIGIEFLQSLIEVLFFAAAHMKA